MKSCLVYTSIAAGLALLFSTAPVFGGSLPPLVISSGWQLQDAAKVAQNGEQVSQSNFQATNWYPATVPGTVLTTLVNNNVYPEPLFGENNRPDKIPESLCRTPYWYRTTFKVPADYAGKKIWLNFDGINYTAEIWVNGQKSGSMRGAFSRGIFDITELVKPGQEAVLAVLVSPQPHPGNPIEHTITQGMGYNGGITALDGATFLCTIGWDWMPGIRDRNTGIWRKVFLTATGPVTVKNPLVTTDLPLPSLDSAEIAIQTTLENVTDQPQKGMLTGHFGKVSFQVPVKVEAHESKLVFIDSKCVPELHVDHPSLWWPNGYGPQNLYTLKLGFTIDNTVSDSQDINFGIRKLTYSVSDSENLTVSVNGVRILCKGGNWGMDEAMKRIPRERLEAKVRLHQIANYTMLRNWVGQSTSEDLYDLCDKYGLLLWDEFFQPNPSDGPNPSDLEPYIANVCEKILRFRNHPSIAIWCARNEGYPPQEIDSALRKVMAELEPTRLYQPSSTDGRGVHSEGPYRWRKPREYYVFPNTEAFKTEIGNVSIPTIESIQGMMPKKDWEVINDDWAEHDLAKGAQDGENYPKVISARYGKVSNLADFVRKAQLANFEAYRALYEGRNARLFAPCTGILTWMSNPAQPSFVWQLYHYDLEPNASLFATRKACEPVHIQLNEQNGHIQVINNYATPLSNAAAHVSIYNLDGTLAYQHDFPVTATASRATDLGQVEWPTTLSSVHFVKLELRDSAEKPISNNFYWRAIPSQPDSFEDLNKLPVVKLNTAVKRNNTKGKCLLEVTLSNPTTNIALMTHLQLRRQNSNERVLPVFYSDNYVSLLPREAKTITIEAALADLKGENPLIVLDGWNIDVTPLKTRKFEVAINQNAQVSHWPVTGLPMDYGTPKEVVKINCGGPAVDGFGADSGFWRGQPREWTNSVNTEAPMSGPASIYQTERYDNSTYTFPMRPLAPGHTYTVRLHFAETSFDAPEKRKITVDINGKSVLKDLDIFQEAGGKDKAIVKKIDNVTLNPEGIIQIQIKGQTGEAIISGIEISGE